MHGRVYPCCVVPAGTEGLGIPLTETWREDILKATPPCASCFFAREGDPAASAALGPERVAAVLSEAAPPTGDMRGPAVWPRPRDEIAIYDIDFDSWMGREAEVVVNPGDLDARLMLYLESHGPPQVHPITLTFEGADLAGSHTHVVTKPGLSVAQVPLGRLLRRPGEARIRLRSDRTFVPSRLDPANPDHRELSVRIRSAIFMAGGRQPVTGRPPA